MKHTLVTFLGRVPKLEGGGYREAKYQFPGCVHRQSANFGLALAEHLSPDLVVVFGTNGSMWGVLVESLVPDSGNDEARLDVLEAEEQEAVTQGMLDRITPSLGKAMGRAVNLRLIPSAKDEAEQYSILEAIGEAVPDGEVSFDLTHGYRHLGMVGFLSAFMLERLRKLDVRGLWYGALDMTDQQSGTTPVLRLDGLSRFRQWLDALDRFDANGDYGAVAKLLIRDGVPEDMAQRLRQAAFHERVLNLSRAAQEIKGFLKVLENPLSGASELFRERLKQRLEWARHDDLAEHQRKLAFQRLNQGDFLRAALFGWEALITRECHARGLDARSYQRGRKPAIDSLEEEIKQGDHSDEKARAFEDLRTIRNALAHGIPPKRQGNRRQRYQRLMGDPDRLRSNLEKSLNLLLSQGRGA